MELLYIFFAFVTGSAGLLSLLSLGNVTGVNTIANRWLGAFYFCLACTFFQLFAEAAGLTDRAPLFAHILELSRWAIFPSFYMAILYFVNPAKKSFAVLLHFLPVLLFLLFSLTFIIPSHFNPARKLPDLPFLVTLLIRYFFMGQTVIYLALSFRQLRIHSRNIRLVSSSIEHINLAWIRYVLFGVLLMAIVSFVSRGNKTVAEISPVVYCIGVFFMGYFSLKQVVIYPFKTAQLPELKQVLSRKSNAERLTEEQVNMLKNKVAQLTKEEKLYLDPALNLPALSARVGISTHELSYVLNTGLRKNFYQFINELRVEEAKRLLTSDKVRQLDMIGIATHAGFNSKTTFNTTFKKMTGQTPTEFLKSHSRKRPE